MLFAGQVGARGAWPVVKVVGPFPVVVPARAVRHFFFFPDVYVQVFRKGGPQCPVVRYLSGEVVAGHLPASFEESVVRVFLASVCSNASLVVFCNMVVVVRDGRAPPCHSVYGLRVPVQGRGLVWLPVSVGAVVAVSDTV